MIITLHSSIKENSTTYQHILEIVQHFPQIKVAIHSVKEMNKNITEIYLLGDTQHISKKNIEVLPGVTSVISITDIYHLLGRHQAGRNAFCFKYNKVTFSQDSFHVFAGLCAVDNAKNVEITMKTLQAHNQVCTRMGVYKPRTNPYSFQGHKKSCLPYVFDLAGKYGIKVIAMEVMHEKHLEEIYNILESLGNPTGVMVQIGTRNTQNFELLKSIGAQTTFPILFKRGFGITLEESLQAAEYLAQAGNHNIIFCLRGMKSLFGTPHRNIVDFAQVPVIKRLTRLPVGIDPSHAVGCLDHSPEGINDIFHATAQGVIAGANMVLADIHPMPSQAWVDGHQAISLKNLSWYLEDIDIARKAYLQRKKLSERN